jgi:hypothetical protein
MLSYAVQGQQREADRLKQLGAKLIEDLNRTAFKGDTLLHVSTRSAREATLAQTLEIIGEFSLRRCCIGRC